MVDGDERRMVADRRGIRIDTAKKLRAPSALDIRLTFVGGQFVVREFAVLRSPFAEFDFPCLPVVLDASFMLRALASCLLLITFGADALGGDEVSRSRSPAFGEWLARISHTSGHCWAVERGWRIPREGGGQTRSGRGCRSWFFEFGETFF